VNIIGQNELSCRDDAHSAVIVCVMLWWSVVSVLSTHWYLNRLSSCNEWLTVDFSVLVGASRTSWDVGRSINGTYLLLSIARGLSQLFHDSDNLWIPKYTVRLVSWGGSDVNHRGMTEFIDVSLSHCCYMYYYCCCQSLAVLLCCVVLCRVMLSELP